METKAAHDLTVVTYNLANYDDHKNWEQRLQMFTQLIMTEQPDVILFQENRLNPDQPTSAVSTQDMAQQILFQLQKEGYYLTAQLHNAPIAYYPFDSFTVPVPGKLSPQRVASEWEGVTAISKLYILETGTINLTPPGKRDGDINPRVTQFICVDLNNFNGPRKPMYFFNTHFAYLIDDAVPNAQMTVDYMKRIVPNGAPFLMAGDLNAEPGSLPIQTLSNSGIIKDLWLYMWGPSVPGLTFPSTKPVKRIDFIWASIDLMSQCKKIYIIGANSGPDGTFPSDHFGVLTTFSIQVPYIK